MRAHTAGDWIIQPSTKDKHFIQAAGIDSPGIAASPAIAVEVVDLLNKAGLCAAPSATFNPKRAPVITPKRGEEGLVALAHSRVEFGPW